MQGFDSGCRRKTPSQLCGGSRHLLTFQREVFLAGLNPAIPATQPHWSNEEMPELLGWNVPLQASLLGARVGMDHPSLDTAALHSKPCRLEADPGNSQYVLTWKCPKLSQHLDAVFAMAGQGKAAGGGAAVPIIDNSNEHTSCHIGNVPPNVFLGCAFTTCGASFLASMCSRIQNLCGFPPPPKPLLLPKLLWLQTLVPLGVCYSQPSRCQLNSFQEL